VARRHLSWWNPAADDLQPKEFCYPAIATRVQEDRIRSLIIAVVVIVAIGVVVLAAR